MKTRCPVIKAEVNKCLIDNQLKKKDFTEAQANCRSLVFYLLIKYLYILYFPLKLIMIIIIVMIIIMIIFIN
jgi:hypothetical protein